MASEEEMMRQMMGFSGFGDMKPSVDTTYEKKLHEAKRMSKPVSQPNLVAEYSDSNEDDDDEELIGPLPPVVTSENDKEEANSSTKDDNLSNSDNDKDEDDDSDDDDVEKELLPIEKIPQSHEITLQHGVKAISAISLDPTGSRLATGGHEYDVKFWDFNSMDVNLRPFRTLQPCECHWIQTLRFSPTGDMLLITAGNAQPKVIDRDGHDVYECKKGDQYIVDMKKTKGHVAMVRCACWDPKNKSKFISCGDDGTIRLWDINQVSRNKDVIRFKNSQNRKTGCTYCIFSADGKTIIGSGQDGSIQGWDTRKMFVNTTFKNMNAHTGNDITCICSSYDNTTLITRSFDETVKQWDLRNFKNPVAIKEDLMNYYSSTNCFFSPDEKFIITGTSVKKDQGNGKLVFLERDTLNMAHEIEFEKASVISSLWHPKINQMVISLSNGNTKVLFDPTKSNKGATLCVGKVKLKRFDPGESLFKPQIINPHSLRMYKEKRTENVKKIKAKQRADPILSHKPEAPLGQTHGIGGRLKEGMSLTGFVIKNIALAKKDDNNPREAILKHAKEASENPYWITPAYSKSQPHQIFDHGSDSGEEKEEEEAGVFSSKRQKKEYGLHQE